MRLKQKKTAVRACYTVGSSVVHAPVSFALVSTMCMSCFGSEKRLRRAFTAKSEGCTIRGGGIDPQRLDGGAAMPAQTIQQEARNPPGEDGTLRPT